MTIGELRKAPEGVKDNPKDRCPTCGATWRHRHTYPGYCGGGSWEWRPDNEYSEWRTPEDIAAMKAMGLK